jgi:predicted 3-demethylubiquinone-9 3-methyltransferase (glyoxalase superfamily)
MVSSVKVEGKKTMQKINPFLWFNGEAVEAAEFYVSIFKNSKIINISDLNNAGPNQDETIKYVTFELDGQRFHALDGGPQFTFSPAISLFVNCETQEEVDHFWEKLSDGGQTIQCGWLTDKYGVTWQIVPTVLGELLSSKDEARTARVMQALHGMIKLDIKGLVEA